MFRKMATTFILTLLLLPLASPSHFYTLVQTLTENTNLVNFMDFTRNSTSFAVSANGGQVYLCEQDGDTHNFNMNLIVNDGSLANIYGTHYTPDGM